MGSDVYNIVADNQKFVTADFGGGAALHALAGVASTWERFTFSDGPNGSYTIQANNGMFVTAEPSGAVFANRGEAHEWEQWTLEDLGNTLFALKSCHGKYLCADMTFLGVLVANRDQRSHWETFALYPPDVPDLLVTTPLVAGAKPPSRARGANVQRARQIAVAKLPDLVAAHGPKGKEDWDRLHATFQAEIASASTVACASGRTLTHAELRVSRQRTLGRFSDPIRAAYLAEFQTAIGAGPPDIDSISSDQVSPGQDVGLFGTNFGPSQGKVVFQISGGGNVELEVDSWTDTQVTATLSADIAGLRPYNGWMWIERGDGTTSNSWPLRFVPVTDQYACIWTRFDNGGPFGQSINEVALANQTLSDHDFAIVRADATHEEGGWAAAQPPDAQGLALPQGYHIGIPAWQNSATTITYVIRGPRGVLPPPMPSPFGPWYMLD